MMSPTEKDPFLQSIITEPVSWWGFCRSKEALLREPQCSLSYMHGSLQKLFVETQLPTIIVSATEL